MSARQNILKKVRIGAGAAQADSLRAAAVDSRLANPPVGVVPSRGQLPRLERVALFCAMAESAAATVERVAKRGLVPKAVAAYLRSRNLPASLRMGLDPRLLAMPWPSARTLQVRGGAADPEDMAGLSHALCGIAETGTLVLASGPENPTSVNFVPEHHIVVIDGKDIVGDLETAFSRIRQTIGRGGMPRSVNLITGPSRSADIEQTVLLGAHGPRALHLVVIDG